MPSGKKQVTQLEMIVAVRAALVKALATRYKSLKALLAAIRAAGVQIASSEGTAQKFKTGRVSLTGNDLATLYEFFTEHAVGRKMIGDEEIDEKSTVSLLEIMFASSVKARIGPAGPLRVENLTGTILLASIEIEGSQWGAGTVGVSVTISCPPWWGFAVQRGRVVMEPGSGALTRDCEANWITPRKFATQGYGQSGTVTVSMGYWTRRSPFWEVVGEDMPIGKLETAPDFAQLEGVLPGSQITVRFGTWLGDVQDVASDEQSLGEDMALLTDGLAQVNAQSTELAMRYPKSFKRRLISLIRSTGLDAGPDGYVDLSRCEIAVVEA